MGLAQSKQDCAPCYFSKPCGEYEIEKNALDGNRLVAELTSKPRDDDYLGQSQAILDSHKCVKENGSVGSVRDFFSSNASDYVPIDKAGDALIGETVGGLRNGIVRHPDGSWYIAVTKNVGKLKGPMFTWWLSNCDTTEKFKWMHPAAHKFCDWEPQFFAKEPGERKPGHFLEHTQRVIIDIDGVERVVQFTFEHPANYFDNGDLKEAHQKKRAVICGRIYLLNDGGVAGVARFIHVLRETPSGENELRSRLWITDYHRETDNTFLPMWMVNAIGNSSLYRQIYAPRSLAEKLWLYLDQQVDCITNFLPKYYNIEAPAQVEDTFASKLEELKRRNFSPDPASVGPQSPLVITTTNQQDPLKKKAK